MKQSNLLPSPIGYTYRIRIVSESNPTRVATSIILYGLSKTYNVDVDVATSSALLFHHTAADGMQGPFRRATFKYVLLSPDSSQSNFRTWTKSFVVFSLYIDYMSHFNDTVRRNKSTQLCSDFKKPIMVTQETNPFSPYHLRYTVIVEMGEKQCCDNEEAFNEGKNGEETSGDMLTKVLKAIKVPKTNQDEDCR